MFTIDLLSAHISIQSSHGGLSSIGCILIKSFNASFPLELAVMLFYMIFFRCEMGIWQIYLLAAICFMRLRALPALNHEICCSLNVWLSLNLSTEPSACLTSHSTGLPGAKLAKPRSEILSVGVI